MNKKNRRVQEQIDWLVLVFVPRCVCVCVCVCKCVSVCNELNIGSVSSLSTTLHN